MSVNQGLTCEMALPDLRLLMIGAQAGDTAAYRTLLGECVPLIRRIALQDGMDASHLDALVHATLATVHRVRHTFDPARPFTPWLHAVAQHRMSDVRRRTDRQGVLATGATKFESAMP